MTLSLHLARTTRCRSGPRRRVAVPHLGRRLRGVRLSSSFLPPLATWTRTKLGGLKAAPRQADDTAELYLSGGDGRCMCAAHKFVVVVPTCRFAMSGTADQATAGQATNGSGLHGGSSLVHRPRANVEISRLARGGKVCRGAARRLRRRRRPGLHGDAVCVRVPAIGVLRRDRAGRARTATSPTRASASSTCIASRFVVRASNAQY